MIKTRFQKNARSKLYMYIYMEKLKQKCWQLSEIKSVSVE